MKQAPTLRRHSPAELQKHLQASLEEVNMSKPEFEKQMQQLLEENRKGKPPLRKHSAEELAKTQEEMLRLVGLPKEEAYKRIEQMVPQKPAPKK